MSRPTETVRFENVLDRAAGRAVAVVGAVVDETVCEVWLPAGVIECLGLWHTHTVRVRTAAGERAVRVFAYVRLHLLGRFCETDVIEAAEGEPTVIGRFALAKLDFVIDAERTAVVGNPDHGGEQLMEMY